MKDAFSKMDRLASERKAFLFVIDFDLLEIIILTDAQIESSGVLFNINGKGNFTEKLPGDIKEINLKKVAVEPSLFHQQFSRVIDELKNGNTYLLNLTLETAIDIDCSLKDIFMLSNAKYKLLYPDRFVVFSPECFLTLKDSHIFTFPMKGTIDARIPGAKEIIMTDPKEMAEHATIVDLLRNDLSKIAGNVKVERYRYLDKINAGKYDLLQVSSAIKGELMPEFINKPGSILQEVLPAGSVTGAPKKKTIELIREIESHKRGFYTGIFGYFDGYNMESAVMIRYIEKRDSKYYYKSGGGITFQSDVEKEYNEYIDKIYVPVH